MITLYVKSNCPYSARAIEALDARNVPYELKNISDPAVALELIELGGKRQVPFIDDHGPCDSAQHLTPCMLHDDILMYDSEKILDYIEENYR